MVKFNLGRNIYLSETAKKPVKIQIVFAVDDNYCQHMSAAMASVLLNSQKGNEFVFHILHGELSKDNKVKLKALRDIRHFEIYFYDMRKIDFSELPLNREYISVATYYRLYILDVLPQNIDKVLYLDCDMIAEGDIAELYKTDIEKYMIAAVEDEGAKYQAERLGFKKGIKYFNAGMCLFNLKKLRQSDFKKKCFEWFRKNKEIIILQDQDILNGVFAGQVKYVSLNWNANGRLYRRNEIEHFYSVKEESDAKLNPKIIHFTDKSKPWQIYCEHPLYKEYWRYLAYTPYKGRKFYYQAKRTVHKICYVYKDFFNTKLKFFGITIFKVKNIYPKKSWYVLGVPFFSVEESNFLKHYRFLFFSITKYDRFGKLIFELEKANSFLERISSKKIPLNRYNPKNH